MKPIFAVKKKNVAGCACVIKDIPPDTLVGGVPAKVIRSLEDE